MQNGDMNGGQTGFVLEILIKSFSIYLIIHKVKVGPQN